MQSPIKNPRVTGGFSSNHPGLDLGHPDGTPVVASEAGVVRIATNHEVRTWIANGKGDPYKLSSGARRPLKTADYGNYIMITHSNGYETLYAHLKHNSIIVAVGQFVQAGQKIAEVGSTGNSSGNHLHFEVRLNGKTIEPVFTPPKENNNMNPDIEREYRNLNWEVGVAQLLEIADKLGVGRPSVECKPENKAVWSEFAARVKTELDNVKNNLQQRTQELNEAKKEVEEKGARISELEKQLATPTPPAVQEPETLEQAYAQVGKLLDKKLKG